MNYLLYLFGFLPSIIWLMFYLRKDSHPESNKMIMKIFFFGIVAAFFAILIEKGFSLLSPLLKNSLLKTILVIFVGGALIEEFLKFLVVRIGVFKNSELDEPLDFMLYMIISALGFASLENILVLSSYHPALYTGKALEVMLWRFVSATFLHALCSALLGYFLILSSCHIKNKIWISMIGIFLATGLHGLYNFSIMKIGGMEKFIIPIAILFGLALFTSFAFKKARNLKGVCIIKYN